MFGDYYFSFTEGQIAYCSGTNKHLDGPHNDKVVIGWPKPFHSMFHGQPETNVLPLVKEAYLVRASHESFVGRLPPHDWFLALRKHCFVAGG